MLLPHAGFLFARRRWIDGSIPFPFFSFRCHEHKIFLKERPWDKKLQDLPPSHFAGTSLSSRPLDKVSFVDLFQDEGNRAGCFALWDSFSDLIDGADLKFIEGLASEMRVMTAEDKVLKSNKMPVDKYIETEWSAQKCKAYIVKGLRGHADDDTAAALDSAQLDGKALIALVGSRSTHQQHHSGDKLQAVLEDLGIKQKLQLQRIRVLVEEIDDKIKLYDAGE